MADWFGHRRNVRWTYRRVDWDTWQEVGEYRGITGGSDEESYFTSVKCAGSLDYIGEEPSSVDAVRAYYSFTDQDGEAVSVPVSTMLVEVTNATIDGGGARNGTVSLYSVLKVAEDRLPGVPLTVAAGTNAVAMAETILNDLGVRTMATPSSYEVASDHTFKPDDSYLTIVNWLLSAAGYGSASPDAYGVAVLAPYVDASKREPVFTFRDDERSIMYPEVENENDYSDTPNVVRLYSEDEYASYYAVVKNVDKDSPASLVNRGGRERTLYDEVSELKPAYDEGDADQDAKAAERLESLVSAAREKLVDNSSEIEYVTIGNGFYPLTQGDSVEIVYGDYTWRGIVTNVSRDHTAESRCTTKVRRYVQRDIETEVQGGVIR